MSAEIPALLYIEKAKIEQKKRLQHERMRHKKDLSSLAHTHTDDSISLRAHLAQREISMCFVHLRVMKLQTAKSVEERLL